MAATKLTLVAALLLAVCHGTLPSRHTPDAPSHARRPARVSRPRDALFVLCSGARSRAPLGQQIDAACSGPVHGAPIAASLRSGQVRSAVSSRLLMELDNPTPRRPRKPDRPRWDTTLSFSASGRGDAEGPAVNATYRERRKYIFATSEDGQKRDGTARGSWVQRESAAWAKSDRESRSRDSWEGAPLNGSSAIQAPEANAAGTTNSPHSGAVDDHRSPADGPPELKRPVSRAPRDWPSRADIGGGTETEVRGSRSGSNGTQAGRMEGEAGQQAPHKPREGRPEARLRTTPRAPSGSTADDNAASSDAGNAHTRGAAYAPAGLREGLGDGDTNAGQNIYGGGDAVPAKLDDRVRKFWEASKERRRVIQAARAARWMQLDAREAGDALSANVSAQRECSGGAALALADAAAAVPTLFSSVSSLLSSLLPCLFSLLSTLFSRLYSLLPHADGRGLLAGGR